MKKLILFSFLITGLWSCQPDASKNSTNTDESATGAATQNSGAIYAQAKLECSIIGTPDRPESELFLIIDDQKIKVDDGIGCLEVPRASYPQYGIPNEVSSASGHWWAGQGAYYFCIAENQSWVVMKAIVGEGGSTKPVFKEIFRYEVNID